MGISYIRVARTNDLPPGNMKEVEIAGRQVLLANTDGRYFAFARECPHEGADLKAGELTGTSLRCDNHSYCFDLQTGECLLPKGGPQLTVLPVEERGEDICIRLEW